MIIKIKTDGFLVLKSECEAEYWQLSWLSKERPPYEKTNDGIVITLTYKLSDER